MPDRSIQPADRVCAVADALEAGDEVRVNDRSRAITVLGRDVDASHGFVRAPDYPYRIVWLRGNGTEYRLRYSHTAEYRPHLHTEGELTTREAFCYRCGERHPRTRATTSGERVRRISVADVPDGFLTDWAFRRNVECLDAGVGSDSPVDHGRED